MKTKSLFILILFTIFLFTILNTFAYTFELSKDLEEKNKKIKPPSLLLDLPPSINIYADSYNVNTTVTITAIATDSGNNAGLVWIKIYENGTEYHNDCNNQPNCVFVRSFTHNQPGVYEYYAKTKDLGGHIVQSQKIYVTFNGINQPPIIISYIPQDLTPEVNENSSLYFEVNAIDPNGDPLTYKFKLDGVEVSNNKNWTYYPDFFSAGQHEVLAIVSDNKGGIATILWNVTVINVLIPTSCNLNFNPPSPIYYNQQPFTTYCSCNNPEANAELWRDGINVTNEIGIPITLAAKPSGYLYVCNVSETQNYASATNQSIYIIYKANHTAHLALNGLEANLQVNYPNQTNATGWLEINQGIENAILLRNGSIVATGSPASEIAILPVGIYNYTYYYPESQNYSSAFITRFLTVLPAQTILNLAAYPSWIITYGDTANITCSANNNEVLIKLYRNGQEVSSGYGLIYDYIDAYELAAGNYLYVCNTTGSQNYSGASVSNTLIIKKANTILNLTALPSWNVVYGTQTNVSCRSNHNQAQINLYRNNQLVNNPDIAILPAGNYMYTCNVSESQNYSSASVSNLLKVNKAQTYIILLLNNVNGNITVNISDNINANATLYIGSPHSQPHPGILSQNENNLNFSLNENKIKQGNFTVYLYINGSVVANGEWNVIYNIRFNQSGIYNFTAYFHGNENYTSASATHFVYVLPDTWAPLIEFVDPTPPNGSILNVNYTLIRVKVQDNLAINTVWLEFDGQNETMIPENKHQPPIWLENIKFYYLNKTNLSNGWHWFRAYANDSFGNINNTEIRWIYVNVTYDTQPPVVNILSPLNATYYTNLIDLNYTVNDNIAIASCWYSLDYGQNISLPNCQNTTLTIGEGNHYLIVYANDTSGNIGYDDVYFTVLIDTQPPNISILSPLNITYTTNQILINISAVDNIGIDKIWYRINNGENKTYTGPIIEYFSDGLHILEAWANDTSSNIGYDNVTFTVNTTIPNNPPIVTLISPPNGSIDTDGNVTVIYTVVDDIATNLSCDIYSNTSGQWQIDFSEIIENGSISSYNYTNLNNGYYIWNVRCFDGINYAFAPQNWSFIVNTTIPDTQPPIIIFIPPTPQNGSIININWVYINTSIIDNVAVAYALLEWNGVNETLPNVMPNIYGKNKTNLTDGIYNYKVYAVDTAGNWNVSEERIVIINTTIINNPPIVQLIWPPNGYIHNSTNITLRFYVEDDLTSLLDCYLWTNISGEWQQTKYAQVNNATTNEFNLTNLDSKVYLWNVECNDGSLNNFAPENWSFIINVTHDVGIDDNYSQSINGIRIIDNETGSIIMDNPANLTYGKNYTARARIMNYGNYPEQVRIIIKIVNSTHQFILRNYTTTINKFHYTYTTFNTSNYNLGNYFIVINVELLNYTDQNLSNNERNREFNIVQQIIDMPPYWINETVNPPSPTIYGSGPYNFSIIWLDDFNINEVKFEFNNLNYTPTCIPSLPSNYTLCYYIFNDLAAGNYNYRWYGKDSAGQINSTTLLSYIINKAQSEINLLLNGNDSDITIFQGENVNHTAILINPLNGTIKILLNGSEMASGNSPLTWITIYNDAGYYNITALFEGNENYTSSYETHFINVIPVVIDLAIENISHSKINSTVYNNDIINVTANLRNLGTANATNVNVTFYNASGHVLNSTIIPLIQPGQVIPVGFAWKGTAPINDSQIHSLQIYAQPVPGETNLTNNGQIISIEVWHACRVIDCSVFNVYTQYNNYPLGQPFLVRTVLQNAWSNRTFYNFPVRLNVSEGLQIIPPWPQQQYINLSPGAFVIVSWNVTSTSTGNKTLTAIAGNDDYLASKNITITP